MHHNRLDIQILCTSTYVLIIHPKYIQKDNIYPKHTAPQQIRYPNLLHKTTNAVCASGRVCNLRDFTPALCHK